MFPNLFKLFKDFQKFQAEVKRIEEELAKEEVTGSSGGGMVEVTLNGRLEAVDIRIEEGLLETKNLKMLQDLILAAFNNAMGKAQEKFKEKIGKITGGLGFPGINSIPDTFVDT